MHLLNVVDTPPIVVGLPKIRLESDGLIVVRQRIIQLTFMLISVSSIEVQSMGFNISLTTFRNLSNSLIKGLYCSSIIIFKIGNLPLHEIHYIKCIHSAKKVCLEFI